MSVFLLKASILMIFLLCIINLSLERLMMVNFLLNFELLSLCSIFLMVLYYCEISALMCCIFPVFILLLCDSVVGLSILVMNFRFQSNVMMESKTFLLW